MSTDVDSIYPKVQPSDALYWIVRTQVDDGKNLLVAYTPLVVAVHPNKAKAEAYMKDKISLLNPKEVKVIGGPFNRTEAFMWCTLNPYVVASDSGGSVSRTPDTAGSNKDSSNNGNNSDGTNSGNNSNDSGSHNSAHTNSDSDAKRCPDKGKDSNKGNSKPSKTPEEQAAEDQKMRDQGFIQEPDGSWSAP